MGKAHPVSLGFLSFTSKNAAKGFFRALRDRYADGEQIEGYDAACLIEMVAVHHEADQKVGCGISHFTVATAYEYGPHSRHFVIHRADGSSTDVSFDTPIDGPCHRGDCYNALRRAIAGQIIAFRDQQFAINAVHICPLTGAMVTNTSYHVDHIPPATFQGLVARWLCERQIELTQLAITPPSDNQTAAEMNDSSQRVDWERFHARNAKLRLVSPNGNLSRSRMSETFPKRLSSHATP